QSTNQSAKLGGGNRGGRADDAVSSGTIIAAFGILLVVGVLTDLGALSAGIVLVRAGRVRWGRLLVFVFLLTLVRLAAAGLVLMGYLAGVAPCGAGVMGVYLAAIVWIGGAKLRRALPAWVLSVVLLFVLTLGAGVLARATVVHAFSAAGMAMAPTLVPG